MNPSCIYLNSMLDFISFGLKLVFAKYIPFAFWKKESHVNFSGTLLSGLWSFIIVTLWLHNNDYDYVIMKLSYGPYYAKLFFILEKFRSSGVKILEAKQTGLLFCKRQHLRSSLNASNVKMHQMLKFCKSGATVIFFLILL